MDMLIIKYYLQIMSGPFTEDNLEAMIRVVMVMAIVIVLCIPIKYFCRYRHSRNEMTTEEISLQDLRIDRQ